MIAKEIAGTRAQLPPPPPAAAPTGAAAPAAPLVHAAPQELGAVQAMRKAAADRRRAAELARAAAAEDPAVQLAEEQLALAREEREASLAEHELEADRLYREACLHYGEERVARVPTVRGSVVMRPASEIEADKTAKLCGAHRRAEAAAKTPAEAEIHARNAEEEARNGIRALVLTSREHLETTTREHFGLWNALARAKNALVDGEAREAGKGGAR
jgi:hypothetical protein